MAKSLIIDDQIGAIRDTAHLIVSKKFLKFHDLTRFTDLREKDKKLKNWNNFQFPDGLGNYYQI